MVTNRVMTRRNFLSSIPITASALYFSQFAYADSPHTENNLEKIAKSDSPNIFPNTKGDNFYEQKRTELLARHKNKRALNPKYGISKLSGGARIGGKHYTISFESSMNVEDIPIDYLYKKDPKLSEEENTKMKEQIENSLSEVIFRYHPVDGKKYPGKRPPILIIPALNGLTPLEEGTAAYFCRKGYPAIISTVKARFISSMKNFFDSFEKDIEDIDYTISIANKLYEQNLLKYMQIIDWMETREELEGSKIGGFAASLGAIQLSSLMGIDNRINSGVLAMVGGNIPKILTYSTLPSLDKIRTESLEKAGKNQKWLENILEGKIIWDPIHHAQHINPEKVYLILAEKDKTIPIETGYSLLERITRGDITPRLKILENGTHYMGIVRDLPGHRRTALGFFKDLFTSPITKVFTDKHNLKGHSLNFLKEKLKD